MNVSIQKVYKMVHENMQYSPHSIQFMFIIFCYFAHIMQNNKWSKMTIIDDRYRTRFHNNI